MLVQPHIRILGPDHLKDPATVLLRLSRPWDNHYHTRGTDGPSFRRLHIHSSVSEELLGAWDLL